MRLFFLLKGKTKLKLENTLCCIGEGNKRLINDGSWAKNYLAIVFVQISFIREVIALLVPMCTGQSSRGEGRWLPGYLRLMLWWYFLNCSSRVFLPAQRDLQAAASQLDSGNSTKLYSTQQAGFVLGRK